MNFKQASIYRHGEQWGEEKHLSPSYVIDFAGCNLGCIFCSERNFWSNKARQIHPEPESFAQYIAQKIQSTQHTFRSVQFVGGEPSLYLEFLVLFCRQFHRLMPHIPCILNTNGYFESEAFIQIKELDGIVFDLKCSPNCQKALIQSEDYNEVVRQRILESLNYFKPEALTIRHLVLPKHEFCCGMEVLEWCRIHAKNCYFNLMDTFVDFKEHVLEVDLKRVQKLLKKAVDDAFPRFLWNGSPYQAV